MTESRRRPRGVRQLVVLLALVLLASACSVHRLDEHEALEAGEARDTSVAVGSGEPGAAGEDGDTTAGPAVTAEAGATPPDAGNGGQSAPDDAAAARPPTANDTGTEPRQASDQGVTPEEIRLGILHTSDAFFAATGGSTKDVNRVIAPFIKEINDNGGINGRKVVPKISTYDPLSADSMKAACVEQAEDHKVFASIAQIGF